MRIVKIFHHKYGNGIWIGRYAFFKAPGYSLPIIVPRFDFQAQGIIDREIGTTITDQDAYLARNYKRQLR